MKPKKNRTSTEFGEIDKTRLDEEWVKHTRLVEHYADQLADAKRDLEIAKTAYDVKEAETSLKIRKRPDRYLENVNVTEKSIETVLTTKMAESQENEDWLDAKHRSDLLQAAMTKLEHRKKALEDLVYLWSAGYFSEPKNKYMDKEDIDRMKSKQMSRKAVKRSR